MAGASQVLTIDTDGEAKLSNGRAVLQNDDGVAIFQSAQFNLGGDTWIYWGAGAPVDYTDGDPAATGEAEAGIGSLYLDTTNGKIYVQGGTKAQPAWNIVTSA